MFGNTIKVRGIKMKKYGIFITLFIAILIASCSNQSEEINTGIIKISIEDQVSSRSIDTNVDLATSYYVVTANGPADSSFTLNLSSSSPQAEKTGIYVGDWTLSVVAYNAGDVAIGVGSQNITVQPKRTTNASIRVKEIEGEGKFTVAIEGSTAPSIVYTAHVFKNENGTLVEVEEKELTKNDNLLKAEFSLANGFYIYSITANVELDLPSPESFRIIAGDTISVSMIAAENPLGNLSFQISNGIKDTPSVSVMSAYIDVYDGEETTLVANCNGFYPISYCWYVDGNQIEGNTRSIDYTFNEGEYRISCVALDGFDTIWTGDKTITVSQPEIKRNRNRLLDIKQIKNYSDYKDFSTSIVTVLEGEYDTTKRIRLNGITSSGEERELSFIDSNGKEITQGDYGLINYYDCGDMILFQFAPDSYISYVHGYDWEGAPGVFDGSASFNGFVNDYCSMAYYWSAPNGYIVRHPKDLIDFVVFVLDKETGNIFKILGEDGEVIFPAITGDTYSTNKTMPVVLIKNNFVGISYSGGYEGVYDYICSWNIDQERTNKLIKIDSSGLKLCDPE